jgi:hypothetical protein
MFNFIIQSNILSTGGDSLMPWEAHQLLGDFGAGCLRLTALATALLKLRFQLEFGEALLLGMLLQPWNYSVIVSESQVPTL